MHQPCDTEAMETKAKRDICTAINGALMTFGREWTIQELSGLIYTLAENINDAPGEIYIIEDVIDGMDAEPPADGDTIQ